MEASWFYYDGIRFDTPEDLRCFLEEPVHAGVLDISNEVDEGYDEG
ncbi:MAG: hypothetical protein HQL56_12055 [Magnetococcales bacterium]|nr:hypothetical protein [Magnetococcales bacterium]